MKQMRLKIELQSDLICGIGEGWGNIIATFVVYDSYGFPYIPAKRVKGLLREACLELDEMGVNVTPLTNKIFGSDSAEGSDLVLTNAVLSNVDDMKLYIDNCNPDEKKELNILNIINYYTNVRCQTAIDDNGIAKENSLRSSRAITRGHIFFADIIFKDDYKSVLENCCAVVHHMGLNRTRGFGDVRLSLDESKDAKNNDEKKFEPEDGKRYTLKLKLKSRSQLSIKTCRGDKSADYISGSAILGFFVGEYLKNNSVDKEFYRLFIRDNGEGLVFENAYISDEKWNEYLPTRLSLYKEKTGKKLLDQSIQKQEQDTIWTRVRNKYACVQFNNIIEPDKEMVYHHRRPDDKAVGHVIDNSGIDTGIFYQKEVISADQYFIGKIKGTGADLKKIFNSNMKYIQIGASKHTQYGNVSIEDFELVSEEDVILTKGTEVVCTLTSPLVILDRKGESILNIKEVEAKLSLENVKMRFTDYVSVGGYNAKWKLQKPSYVAFSPGTCVTGTLSSDMKNEVQIGAFRHEGMGKIVLNTVDEIKKSIDAKETNPDLEKPINKVPKDLKDILVDSMKHKSRLKTLEALQDDKCDKMITSTLLGRLLKMLEKGSWKDFEDDYKDIAKVEKKEEVSRYIKNVRAKCNETIDDSGIIAYVSENEIDKLKDEFCMLILKDKFSLAKYERRNKQ